MECVALNCISMWGYKPKVISEKTAMATLLVVYWVSTKHQNPKSRMHIQIRYSLDSFSVAVTVLQMTTGISVLI